MATIHKKEMNYRIDFFRMTLIMTAEFAANAYDPTTAEYKVLTRLKKDFPDLKIERKTHRTPHQVPHQERRGIRTQPVQRPDIQAYGKISVVHSQRSKIPEGIRLCEGLCHQYERQRLYFGQKMVYETVP